MMSAGTPEQCEPLVDKVDVILALEALRKQGFTRAVVEEVAAAVWGRYERVDEDAIARLDPCTNDGHSWRVQEDVWIGSSLAGTVDIYTCTLCGKREWR